MDKYELGDLSGKFGNLAGLSSLTRQNIGVQLSLFGRYSILNRALVIHRNDTGGSRWICSNILPASSPKQLSATANFTTTSGLKGMVNLVSYDYIFILADLIDRHKTLQSCNSSLHLNSS